MDKLSVKLLGGTPTLYINDEPKFCAMLMTTKNLKPDVVGYNDDPFALQFAQAGFTLFSTDNGPFNFDATYDPETDSFPEERFERLEEYKEYVKRIPDAKFLIRVFCEPRGKDSAWIQKYPEECEIMESQETEAPYLTPSYASEKWLADAERYIKALGEQIIKRGLADNLFGLLIGCGDSIEWVKIGPMEDLASDYSKPMQRAFSKWLKEKYGTVQRLEEAFGKKGITFEDDLVPTPEEQSATDIYLFKEPVKRAASIDYFDFLSDLVASDISRLCTAAKKATDYHHLTGVFYGYLQEMVWNNGFFGQGKPESDILHSAAARSGHGGLEKVLASKDVDFLCSPYSYGFRGIGGEGGFMSPYESVRLAGKLWISEEDIRTHRWKEGSGYGQANNKEELIELLKRQFSNLLVHSAGAWWCDWASGSYGTDKKNELIGSFDEPEIMQLFDRLVKLGEHSLSSPDRTSPAEIAIVIDAKSSFYRSTENSFDIPNWRGRAWGISRMGAPVDYVLLSDMLSGKAKKYKMYYMMNIFHLSADDRAKLKAIVQRDNIVTLWIYAPGFADEEHLDIANIEDLTGMKIKMRNRRWSCNVFVSNFEHEITKKLPTSTFFGTDMQLGPIFSIDPSSAVSLGTSVSQQGRCECGFAVKECENYTSVYSVVPNIPPGVLNGLARFAGVHMYCDSEDVFYASREYVCLHTVRGEKKHVTLPRVADVYDAFTGECIALGTAEFDVDMKAGTTMLLYYGDRPLPKL